MAGDEKDRIPYGHIRTPRPGETPAQTGARIDREFAALQAPLLPDLGVGSGR